MTYRKKLIEVALPLDAINAEAEAEKKNPFIKGHPRGIHQWWARRPLAVCRAIIFASLLDDPESEGCPKQLLDAIDRLLPDSSGQKSRRERLFDFIGELVKWKNTTNEHVLGIARELIQAATGGKPPPVLDPFCGGGSIPLEAQRLGLEAYASELNPVAVLITKALVEIPPKFAGRPPVNPDARNQMGQGVTWKGAAGLAADVRWYGKWMRDRAWERIGHLYPKEPNGETVIAWLWARTVKCPNPACGAQMPLVRSFWLATKQGKEAWVDPIVDRQAKTVRFEMRTGRGTPPEPTKQRAQIYCLICGEHVTEEQLRQQAVKHGLGTVPLATVAEGTRQRVYLSGTAESPEVNPPQHDGLDAPLSGNTRWFSPPIYGLTTFADLFTPRQLVALTTFSDLVGEARALLVEHTGGDGEYADAVVTYLALAISRLAAYCNTICIWHTGSQILIHTFTRQAIQMTWDFAETNALEGIVNWQTAVGWVADSLASVGEGRAGSTSQLDAASALPSAPSPPLVCTDPPYHDNIGYADLSDFFYVWLRRTVGRLYPDLFSTVLTPKAQELVATPYRFDGDKRRAEQHFEEGLRKAFALIRQHANVDYPVTLYYAFKQAEEEDQGNGRLVQASTGWQTMLEGLLRSGFQLVGTWPMRTELVKALKASINALASSIVLVCRPRPADAPIATRREFLAALRQDLPPALRVLTGHGSTHPVSPVDLAQAVIGPGMAVFSSYSRVLEADGSPMSVRTALQLINRAIEDYFTEQEGELDPDSQFCARWFEQHGLSEGPFGDAETLAKAKNVAVDALKRLGLLDAKAGKVRIAPRSGYSAEFDPAQRPRLTIWEACQRLVATLQDEGEADTARLARRLGGLAERARDLAYRLYSICDRKGWAEEAFGYNALVASWPEIQKQAAALAEETQAPLI